MSQSKIKVQRKVYRKKVMQRLNEQQAAVNERMAEFTAHLEHIRQHPRITLALKICEG